jgi:hypothetical protein
MLNGKGKHALFPLFASVKIPTCGTFVNWNCLQKATKQTKQRSCSISSQSRFAYKSRTGEWF